MKLKRVDKLVIFRHVIGLCLWNPHISVQDYMSKKSKFKDMFWEYGYGLDMKRGERVAGKIDRKLFLQTKSQIDPAAEIRLFPGRGIFCDHLHERPEMPVRRKL